jgi:hypothetical protein
MVAPTILERAALGSGPWVIALATSARLTGSGDVGGW